MGSPHGPEVGALLDRLAEWAQDRPDIRAVALTGSWARGEAGPDSDLDLVVLTYDPLAYIGGDEWLEGLEGPAPAGTEDWGALTSRRLLYPSGLEVEVGIGDPSWAATDPVDEGTAGLVAKGLRPIYDPDRLLEHLAEARSDEQHG